MFGEQIQRNNDFSQNPSLTPKLAHRLWWNCGEPRGEGDIRLGGWVKKEGGGGVGDGSVRDATSKEGLTV